MAPYDLSGRLLRGSLNEERSHGYGRWLNLRDGGDGDGGKGKHDGNGGGDNNDDKKSNDDGGDGKKNRDKNNDQFSAATSAAATTFSPSAAASTTLLPIASYPNTYTTSLPPQPTVQPAFSAALNPEVASSPIATTTAKPINSVSSTSATTPLAVVAGKPSSIPVVPISTSSPSSISSSIQVATTTISASPVVTSITATTTEVIVQTSSSNERKGEKDHGHDHSNKTTTGTSLADNAAGNYSVPGLMEHQHEPPLSPTAEHLLLAAGIIGAFILIGFLFYMFLRMRKTNIGGKFYDLLDRHPKLERMLSMIPAIRKRNQWSRMSSSPGLNKHDSYNSTALGQKSMGTFYISNDKPTTTTSPNQTSSTRDTVDFSEKAVLYGMGTNHLAPLYIMNPSAPSATMSLYNVQAPALAYIPNAARMSEVSSLSSGFGDAQIDVPESGPKSANTGTINSMTGFGSINTNAASINTLQPYRQSFIKRASTAFAEPLTSRFSWTTANKDDLPREGQRDTMYTATSEDSAPRFRTIHSWVNQQTNRVEKGRTERVPSMPPLPPSQRHMKHESEDTAFRHHPGEQVNIPETTRIESVILDGKLETDV